MRLAACRAARALSRGTAGREQSQASLFLFKSHKAKPLYEKTHPAWISAFKQEVTSLTDLTAKEPAGLELDLEPVLYSPCPRRSSFSRQALPFPRLSQPQPTLLPTAEGPGQPPAAPAPSLGPQSHSVANLAQLLPRVGGAPGLSRKLAASPLTEPLSSPLPSPPLPCSSPSGRQGGCGGARCPIS